MSEVNGELNFEEMLASAVEKKLGSLVSQNQSAMNVFIALLARQRAAGVNDPVIHVPAAEINALIGQTVRFTRYPDGSLKVYTPGSAHEATDARDWNKQAPEKEDLPV